MKARWTVESKTIRWNGIFGKDCCIPTVSYNLELEVEDECIENAGEIFVDFSLANDGDGKVELVDGTLVANLESDSNEVEKFIGCLPRQVRWSLSSILASGRQARLLCRPLDA